jgi:hypothetical protein
MVAMAIYARTRRELRLRFLRGILCFTICARVITIAAAGRLGRLAGTYENLSFILGTYYFKGQHSLCNPVSSVYLPL